MRIVMLRIDFCLLAAFFLPKFLVAACALNSHSGLKIRARIVRRSRHSCKVIEPDDKEKIT